MEERTLKEITPPSVDFSQWYLDVVLKAELADYGPVKGCMVIRPYGYAIWENLQAETDRRIKALGHKNAYFPLLIPKSFLQKEADHVKGFAPECAWVTIGGGEELEEPLAIRPTSEAMICSMYAKWVKSWRDLPVLLNQWCNVLRWEKVTRPFLRTTEFLWQEGHTLHATADEAQKETLSILDMYREVAEDVLAMPVHFGPKSESEKFAGASMTYAIEALMGDGKALQAGTSHNLGQHFAKAYGIEYVDQNQQMVMPWSTSWGVSTRLIGGMIMTHGDDRGLVIPPKVAPYQVVIVPIPPRKGDWNEAVLPKARALAKELAEAGIRVHLDDRDNHQMGFKYADWEMRGVPIRMELGPKDIEKDSCVLVRRDTREKEFVPLAGISDSIRARLDAIQKNLLEKARKFREENTSEPANYEAFKEVMAGKRGFLLAGMCSSSECEAKIKEETKATVRCFPLLRDEARACIRCGSTGKIAYFAQAY